MCYDLDDAGTDIDYEWRTARKAHRCHACREAIRPGDRYHRSAQVYEGEFCVFKHCARCWAITQSILDAGAETVAWDLNCGETWRDVFGDLPEDVAALAFMTPDEAQASLPTGQTSRYRG